ncbi:MAG: hypothetical protein E5W93_11755 [Mesorhizobium sp.]|nr:MAG: hypothetical protein E5W93_11755 [Mesorhizobium sp.]TIW18689.1 MAG: hypothetical protein E5V65_12225 [Mesorhizobium sp.]
MSNFINEAAAIGKRYAHAFAVVALVSMVSGCQSMDTTRTGSISGNRPVANALGKKVHYVKKKRLYRKPLTQTTSATRVREEAYAAFVRPQRIRTPAPIKVSYSAGPLLGHSPWICGPSGFGQRSACRAR